MKAWRLGLTTGVLLISLFLWPHPLARAAGRGEIWVDDNYCPTCANDGHTWGSNAFSSISRGIDAVAPGGIVHVLPGRYVDDVRIDRPCTLSADRLGAQLAPRLGDATLTVAANNVTVKGLEVTGGKQAAILIVGPAFQNDPIHDVAIRDNTVRGGYFGIAANIDAARNYGKLPAAGLQINDNTVMGCTRAVYVYNARAEIVGNAISDLGAEGIGIYSSQDSTSTIRDNRVNVDAVDACAVYILDNWATSVDGNILVGSTDILTPTTAFTLYGYQDLLLANNTVDGFYWGASACTGGSARIFGNTFRNAAAWALNLGAPVTTTLVTIEDNIISGSYWGLKLDDDAGWGLQAKVMDNTFSDNIIGVQLAASVQEGQAELHGNTFCGNLVAGLRNESEARIDASDNWWGASDGPRPYGSGDLVEDAGRVQVAPWARIAVSTRPVGDGRVVVTGALKGSRYDVPSRPLTFTVEGGVFVDPAGASHSLRAPARGETAFVVTVPALAGEAQVTVAGRRGEVMRVTVRDGCGPGVSVSVRN